jgi:hypothetical protein
MTTSGSILSLSSDFHAAILHHHYMGHSRSQRRGRKNSRTAGPFVDCFFSHFTPLQVHTSGIDEAFVDFSLKHSTTLRLHAALVRRCCLLWACEIKATGRGEDRDQKSSWWRSASWHSILSAPDMVEASYPSTVWKALTIVRDRKVAQKLHLYETEREIE